MKIDADKISILMNGFAESIDETIGAGSRAVDGAIPLKEAVFAAVRQADHRFDGAALDSQGRSRTNYVGQAALDALYGTGWREVTTNLPTQKFRIGQRVQLGLCEPFVIQSMFLSHDGRIMYADGIGRGIYEASILTLAPERPPYVPSERLVVGRRVTIARYQPELYRCETDAELAARHAVERAQYDAQGDEA